MRFKTFAGSYDDLLGEENFIATVIWQKVYSPENSARHFSEDHDYIVTYARNAVVWSRNFCRAQKKWKPL